MERKGICKNVGACALANKVQIITDDDAEFICRECGEELQKYKEEEPAKKKSKTPLIIGIAVVLLAVVAVCLLLFTNRPAQPERPTVDEPAIGGTINETPEQTATETLVQSDTTAVQETVAEPEQKAEEKTADVETPKTQTTNPASGSLRLSYGTYAGEIKNGYPHGQGRLTYSTSRQINRNDVKGRTANAGDYVIGEFFNGFVVYGKHYNSKGELLGSLNFGVGPESNYESK